MKFFRKNFTQMRKEAKKISVFLIFIFAVSGIFAQQQAVIGEIAGTVEVKRAGFEVWEAARQGQVLGMDNFISTGFKSTAVIILGNSYITLRPLTRVSILELSQNQSSEKVELKLQTGRIRADVNPPNGGQTEFVIRSPNSTSSVRGTTFELDTMELSVLEGTVEFSGVQGAPVLIDAVGYSQIDERTGRAASPSALVATELKPDLPIGAEPISVTAAPASGETGGGTDGEGTDGDSTGNPGGSPPGIPFAPVPIF